MGYAGAQAWQALGSGLTEIGKLLLAQKLLQERQGAQDQADQTKQDALTARAMAEPGAMTLESALTDPTVATGPHGALTDQSLKDVADASNTAPFNPSFVKPPPAAVPGTGDKPMMVQDRAPFLSAPGVVEVPQAARQEAELPGRIKAAQEATAKQANLDAIAKVYMQAGMDSNTAHAAAVAPPVATEWFRAHDKAKTGTELKPMTPEQARDYLYTIYGETRTDPTTGREALVMPEAATKDWIRQAVQNLTVGKREPPLPAPESVPPPAFLQWHRSGPSLFSPPAPAAGSAGAARAALTAPSASASPSPGDETGVETPPKVAAPSEAGGATPDATEKTAADTAGFGRARARALQLQAQGKPKDEIIRTMNAEGFKVVP